MIERSWKAEVDRLLDGNPAVVPTGPRQVGRPPSPTGPRTPDTGGSFAVQYAAEEDGRHGLLTDILSTEAKQYGVVSTLLLCPAQRMVLSQRNDGAWLPAIKQSLVS